MERKAYPSDVSDAEWALVAPYLTLMTEDAPQRDYPLREVFNGLRWMARGGSSWRMMPHDLPPYYVVYQQMRRWLKAGVFELLDILDGLGLPRAICTSARHQDVQHQLGAVVDQLDPLGALEPERHVVAPQVGDRERLAADFDDARDDRRVLA